MKRKILSGLCFLSVLFGVTGPVLKAETRVVNVEKAINSGDHQALAAYYRGKAVEQKKMADIHEQMKTEYKNSHVHYKGMESSLASHCEKMKKNALKLAEEYEELAKKEEKAMTK